MASTKRTKAAAKVDVWKCKDLQAMIKQEIRAHVKDVATARKLEQALGHFVAYGSGGGGGGNIGIA
ncbi:MAG TPA: hypothetical protein VG323_22175 [Thermoanaerobaculia bacterium]|nr:hypothetical protein [Thermoanaerobaculia bacterium]